jgi:PP-loop superfamily ATP-utilizing enzyme
MLRRDHALHGYGAKIADLNIIACLQMLHRILVETETKTRGRIGETEEHDFANGAKPARFNRRKQRLALFAVGLERYQLAADHVSCGSAVFHKSSQRNIIAATGDSAVDRTGGVAKRRPRA